MIEVYDTYVRGRRGELIHFDVLVNPGTEKGLVEIYAKQYLVTQLNKINADIDIVKCDFCHLESVTAQVKLVIEQNGYAIIPLEGCS